MGNSISALNLLNVVDLVFIFGVLTIMITTLRKNHKLQLRKAICALIAFGGCFFAGQYFKDVVSNYLTQFNLVQYISFVPTDVLTEDIKLLVGFVVVLLVGLIIYWILLLITQLFNREGRKLKKDISYSTVHNPICAFIAGLFKSVLFVYLFALFIYVTNGTIEGLDATTTVLYPLLQQNGLLIWAEEIKEIAQMVL